MLAVDTNLLVRLLANDDVSQGTRANALFARNEIWISKTVLLETEWVLRSLYGVARPRLIDGLRGIAALPNVRMEDAASVASALLLARGGMDLADALHVSSCPTGTRFITFDRDLVKAARRAGLSAVELG